MEDEGDRGEMGWCSTDEGRDDNTAEGLRKLTRLNQIDRGWTGFEMGPAFWREMWALKCPESPYKTALSDVLE